MAKTTLTTKLASLAAAFGIAIGVVKILDETTISHEPIQLLPADDGQETGMAIASPFEKANRRIIAADHQTVFTSQESHSEISPVSYINRYSGPLSESDIINLGHAKKAWQKFLAVEEDNSVPVQKKAAILKQAAFYMDLDDPRHFQEIGDSSARFTQALKKYTTDAIPFVLKDIEQNQNDPVGKMLLYMQLEDFDYYRQIGGNKSDDDLSLRLEGVVKTGAAQIAPDVLREALGRISQFTDPDNLTRDQANAYIDAHSALRYALSSMPSDAVRSSYMQMHGITEEALKAMDDTDWKLIDKFYPWKEKPAEKQAQPSPSI